MLSKELKFLLDAGMPLFNALTLIGKQKASVKQKKAIELVREDVSSGLSLSAALKRQGSVFPEIFVSIVAAGEGTGLLSESLSRAESYFEASDTLKKKVVSSVAYPCFVLTLSFVSILFMALYLVPMMNGIFSSMGIKLPLLTRAVARGGSFIANFWYLIALFSFALVYFANKFVKARFGDDFFDRIILRFPVVGTIAKKMSYARIAGTLSALLCSGVALVPSLSVSAASAGNRIFKAAVLAMIKTVEGGESLSKAFAKSGIFPESFSEMVNIGESSGRLDAALRDLAGYYEREVESSVKVATSLIEPLSTVLVGVAVFVIVFSMFLPMVAMMDALAK